MRGNSTFAFDRQTRDFLDAHHAHTRVKVMPSWIPRPLVLSQVAQSISFNFNSCAFSIRSDVYFIVDINPRFLSIYSIVLVITKMLPVSGMLN